MSEHNNRRIHKTACIAVIAFLIVALGEGQAQYAEWYLECTVGERHSPTELESYARPYEKLERIEIYMPFNNSGSLNSEAAKIIYKDLKEPKNDISPFSLFNTVRFNKGPSLVTGKVSWTGVEPRSLYPRGWSIAGELVVNELRGQAIYSENLLQGNKVRAYIKTKCIFNNPN